MTHRFPIKDIALQSGLSTATVDRVLNGRAHVSPQTRARVTAAITELEGQEAQLAARGRRLFVDVVVEAPARFSREIRAAADAVMPQMAGAVLRPRFFMAELRSEAETLAILTRIARRGSQGVLLKARSSPAIRAAVADLTAKRIPVVTIFTDLPGSDRIAYAGLNNIRAGQTAAWLVARLAPAGAGHILCSRSQSNFEGEEARLRGFGQALAQTRPDLSLVDLVGGAGLDTDTRSRVRGALADSGPVAGVYSMGGGNRAILDAFGPGAAPALFVAHDLDQDNRALLAAGRITVVLHHDLRQDLRHACAALLRYHGLAPRSDPPDPSDVQIFTPANLPFGPGPG